jgi:hypothetical protein
MTSSSFPSHAGGRPCSSIPSIPSCKGGRATAQLPSCHMGMLSLTTAYHLEERQSVCGLRKTSPRIYPQGALPPRSLNHYTHTTTQQRARPPSPTPTLPNKRVCPLATKSKGAVFPASRREGQAPAHCVPGAPSLPMALLHHALNTNILCDLCALVAQSPTPNDTA